MNEPKDKLRDPLQGVRSARRPTPEEAYKQGGVDAAAGAMILAIICAVSGFAVGGSIGLVVGLLVG